MANEIYVGVNGKARKAKALYVGVDGKARKVKKVYAGIGGKARLAWSGESLGPFSCTLTVSFANRMGKNVTADCTLYASQSGSVHNAAAAITAPYGAMLAEWCRISGVESAAWNRYPYVTITKSGGESLVMTRDSAAVYSVSDSVVAGFFGLYGETTQFSAEFTTQDPSGEGPDVTQKGVNTYE